MENLMESNERTLVIFDSVCLGLNECLALVHADIKQMAEHKNKLGAQQKESEAGGSNNTMNPESLELDELKCSELKPRRGKKDDTSQEGEPDDDPHHLARLKLLDKRLADTFCQALTMCDQQNTSLIDKRQQQQATSNGGSNILNMLLKKASSKSQLKSSDIAKQQPIENEYEQRRAVISVINKQTRLAMQYSKQLESHLLKIEDLRSRYEMQLKMGLVFRSGSRAYLSCSSSPSSSPALAGTLSSHSNSLRRHPNQHRAHRQSRPTYHTSSLVVNDSSSSLGTQSSMSSLNLLSTWSFARKNRQSSQPPQQTNDQLPNYISTISLDRQSRCSKRRPGGLVDKLTTPTQKHQQQLHHQREPSPDYYDYEDQYPDYLPPKPSHRYNHQSEMFADHFEHDYLPETPNLSRPLSQYSYGEYGIGAVPTTTGTLAGIRLQSPGNAKTRAVQSAVIRNQTSTVGPTLNKSASHSSLGRAPKLPHNGRQTIIANNKTTVKEFIENITRLETEFESYIGSFMLNIEDIQGFARICRGDVFEVSIRYGVSQKFKTKISVLKDNKQKCDNRQTMFKAKIADVIAVKAYECKGLGKKTLLGNKLCETRDLFTARSQLMTISLNQTGSIKLNLVITWNPLHLVPGLSLTQILPNQDGSFHFTQKASN